MASWLLGEFVLSDMRSTGILKHSDASFIAGGGREYSTSVESEIARCTQHCCGRFFMTKSTLGID